MLELYGHSFDALKKEVKGFSLGDKEILQTIADCQERNNYTLDPHGAIGYAGLKQKLKPGQKGVFLETAHPIKFAPTMAKALGQEMEMPAFANDLMTKQKSAQKIGKGYGEFVEVLTSLGA